MSTETMQSLTAGSSPRLVNHDFAVRQRVALPFGSPGQQHGAHAGCEPDAHGGNVRFDVLHCVVDGQSCRDGAAGTVDVQLNVFLVVIGSEKKQLRHDRIGDCVINRGAEENNPVFQQPGVDVVPAFTFTGLLHDVRCQIHRMPSCSFRTTQRGPWSSRAFYGRRQAPSRSELRYVDAQPFRGSPSASAPGG
jgi:hypothetical protein